MRRLVQISHWLIPLVLCLPSVASATLTITSPTITSGGGVSSGGSILVTATIGEPIAGYSAGGTISINAGFIAAVAPQDVTAVSAILERLEIVNGHVQVTWLIPGGSSLHGIVQRRQDGNEWMNLAGPMAIQGPEFIYEDGSISLGARYTYRLFLQDQTDSWYTNEASILVPSTPLVSRLRRVAPNPFSSQTSIWFDVAKPAKTTIRIFDSSGRLVRTITEGVMVPNQYKLDWDGRDARGRSAAAGVYFCLFESGPTRETNRITLLR